MVTNNSKLSAWPSMLSPPFLGADQSASSNPLAQSLSSGMEFMKNIWGQMPSGVPGFVVPTIDLEELDKRIADLKAVEGWLELNANMLKATIQGLEVQRNTVAALQVMGQQGGFNQILQDLQKAQTQAGWSQQGASVPSDHTSAFASSQATPTQSPGADSTGSHANWPMQAGETATPPLPGEPSEPILVPGSAKKSASRKAPAPHKPAASPIGQPEASEAVNSAALVSANIWMNFLKDQFSQIAGAVRSDETPVSKTLAKSAIKPSAASLAKPSKKKALPKKRAKKHADAKRVLASRR